MAKLVRSMAAMQPTLECVALASEPQFSYLCPALGPHRHPAGCAVCPCSGKQNHPHLQWLYCSHETWLSHPRAFPLSFIKSLTGGPPQELQEGSMDGQVQAKRRAGCSCRNPPGLDIEDCPGKQIQIKQTFTSLPVSVRPPMAA